jgi:hypothetical protein
MLSSAFATGAGDLVAPIHAYFEEGPSDTGERFLCVAGYIFDGDGARAFDSRWAATLQRFELPYFRMSACAHGSEPFHKLTKDERSNVEEEVIRHIKEHARIGFCTSISDRLALETLEPADPYGSAYALLSFHSLLAVRDWLRTTNFKGSIAYVFEAGDRFQRQANTVMDAIFLLPEERAAIGYAGHAFVDRTKVQLVQAADVLAWHMVADRRREQEGTGRSADFQQLLQCWTLEKRLTAAD